MFNLWSLKIQKMKGVKITSSMIYQKSNYSFIYEFNYQRFKNCHYKIWRLKKLKHFQIKMQLIIIVFNYLLWVSNNGGRLKEFLRKTGRQCRSQKRNLIFCSTLTSHSRRTRSFFLFLFLFPFTAISLYNTTDTHLHRRIHT